MLVRLLYVSKEIAKQPSQFAESNLDKFRIENKLSEITGVLCSGEGIFLQVLEGERSAVSNYLPLSVGIIDIPILSCFTMKK